MIAKDQLGLSSSGYGLLLGALGVGAVLGAFLLSRLRARFGQNTLLTVGAAGFAVATVVLALVPNFVVVLLALVVGGASWLLSLSTLNASMQLSLPAWVRARGLSVYQLIFMGGQAIGSVVWGVLAGATTSATSLLVGAALLVVCGLSSLWWPLHAKTSDLDLTPSSHWPEPTLIFEPEPLDGPVLVLTSYRVAPEDEEAFPGGDGGAGPVPPAHRGLAVAAVPQRRARVDVRGDVRRAVLGRAHAPALHPAHRSGPAGRGGRRAVHRRGAGVRALSGGASGAMSWWPGRVDVSADGRRVLNTSRPRAVGAHRGSTRDRCRGVGRVALLDEAVKPPGERVRWQARRDDAYRMAHQARAAAQAAVAEPPPVSALAIRVIPAATDLEDVVDAITAVAASAEVGVVDATRVGALRDQLSRLAKVGSE